MMQSILSAEIRTCNLPNASQALYHTAASAPKLHKIQHASPTGDPWNVVAVDRSSQAGRVMVTFSSSTSGGMIDLRIHKYSGPALWRGCGPLQQTFHSILLDILSCRIWSFKRNVHSNLFGCCVENDGVVCQ